MNHDVRFTVKQRLPHGTLCTLTVTVSGTGHKPCVAKGGKHFESFHSSLHDLCASWKFLGRLAAVLGDHWLKKVEGKEVYYDHAEPDQVKINNCPVSLVTGGPPPRRKSRAETRATEDPNQGNFFRRP